MDQRTVAGLAIIGRGPCLTTRLSTQCRLSVEQPPRERLWLNVAFGPKRRHRKCELLSSALDRTDEFEKKADGETAGKR